MREPVRFIFFILGILFLILFSSLGASRVGECPIQADTEIVIYGDTGTGGVGSLSRSWITHFMEWWKSEDSGIRYVFLDRNDLKYNCNLAAYPNVKLHIQPGGNAYYQQKALGNAGKTNILNYLDSNGSYLGICAGAFYAANDYYWQGKYYDWPYLLKRFPTFEGSVIDIADYDSNPGYSITSIDNKFDMVYYGGPTRGWKNTSLVFPGEQKLTFTSIPGNLPASIKNGNMLLMSTHAEAFENDGIIGLSTEKRLENYKWLANAINELMRTNYYVPAYRTSECSDGIDNDSDGFIDLADSNCTNADDNSEFDIPEPVNIFFDDFEQGSLNNWALNTVEGGNPWGINTINSFDGIYYAEAKPQSTSEPASVMETSLDLTGYANIEFSYYRKLVGIDIADEFQVKWFNGITWSILEQIGSNSADDSSYVYKSFVLPASADFRIKFECTAGAVSEFCRVDNVRIVSTN